MVKCVCDIVDKIFFVSSHEIICRITRKGPITRHYFNTDYPTKHNKKRTSLAIRYFFFMLSDSVYIREYV